MDDILELEVSMQQLISADQAYHYCIVPQDFSSDKICFYSATDGAGLKDELEMVFGKEVLLLKVQNLRILEYQL